MDIGNRLDINLRQASGAELAFVTLTEETGKTTVNFDTNGILTGEYSLVLESFDLNSTVRSSLKTDLITITITASADDDSDFNAVVS